MRQLMLTSQHNRISLLVIQAYSNRRILFCTNYETDYIVVHGSVTFFATITPYLYLRYLLKMVA